MGDNGFARDVVLHDRSVGFAGDLRHRSEDHPRPLARVPEVGIACQLTKIFGPAQRDRIKPDGADEGLEVRIDDGFYVVAAAPEFKPKADERMDIAMASDDDKQDVQRVVCCHGVLMHDLLRG